MNQDRRPSKSTFVCEDTGRDVRYDLQVKGLGTFHLRVVTIDEATGRVELRAAITEAA